MNTLFAVRSPGKSHLHAMGRTHQPGVMNKLEAEYAQHLADEKHAGRVAWWLFEPIKLRLAKATFYTPDFLVMTDTGLIEVHETKGFWEDDARVKMKVAAAMFPFRFLGITKRAKKDGGGWAFEEF